MLQPTPLLTSWILLAIVAAFLVGCASDQVGVATGRKKNEANIFGGASMLCEYRAADGSTFRKRFDNDWGPCPPTSGPSAPSRR